MEVWLCRCGGVCVCTGNEEDSHGDHCHVSEVQEVGDVHVGLEAGEVQHRIEEDVERRGAAGEERAPPPSVVLRAELQHRHKHTHATQT